MTTYRILVINQSPEAAGEINSLLNNSGISVRVLFASTQYDLDAISTDKSPDIIIIQNPDPADLDISTIDKFCQKFPNASTFVRRSTNEMEFIKHAFEAGFSGFLDMNNPEITTRILKRELVNRQASTELQMHQKVLADIEDRYKLLLESSRDPVAYVHEGFHIYANPAYMKLFEIETFEDLEGTSVLELLSLTEDEGDFRKLLKRINRGELPDHDVHAISNHNKKVVDLEFLTARFKGEHCIQLWIHERKSDPHLTAELERLRTHDALTGLSNRSNFLAALENTPDCKRENLTCGVLLIEPDQFNKITGELGARGTDDLLGKIAHILSQECPEDASCARYRDSVFAALIMADNKTTIDNIATSILQRCRDNIFDLGDHSITATCSIGLTYIGQLQHSADDLIWQSSSALQIAQEEGGDRFSRYRPQLTTVGDDSNEEQWSERLHYAINHAHENLLIIQQAIVDVANPEQDLYIEAFTYMRDGKDEIPPSEYMPKAQLHKLDIEIDRVILPRILSMIAHPESATEVSTYFYSLSKGSMTDSAFPGWLRQQFESTGADSSRLILQLAGSDIAKNLKPAKQLIQTLSDLNCQYSIADFNNDKSLLSALQFLDVNFLKLAPEVTLKIGSDNKVKDAVQQLVIAARDQQVKVIAGDIRSNTDLSNIWSTGIELVQGDFLKHKTRVVSQ